MSIYFIDNLYRHSDNFLFNETNNKTKSLTLQYVFLLEVKY